VLGGGLSQAFGWRSTFMCVIMYAAVILLPLLTFVGEA
jgi:predicted MFS family arabinose efflux permease